MMPRPDMLRTSSNTKSGNKPLTRRIECSSRLRSEDAPSCVGETVTLAGVSTSARVDSFRRCRRSAPRARFRHPRARFRDTRARKTSKSTRRVARRRPASKKRPPTREGRRRRARNRRTRRRHLSRASSAPKTSSLGRARAVPARRRRRPRARAKCRRRDHFEVSGCFRVPHCRVMTRHGPKPGSILVESNQPSDWGDDDADVDDDGWTTKRRRAIQRRRRGGGTRHLVVVVGDVVQFSRRGATRRATTHPSLGCSFDLDRFRDLRATDDAPRMDASRMKKGKG